MLDPRPILEFLIFISLLSATPCDLSNAYDLVEYLSGQVKELHIVMMFVAGEFAIDTFYS